MLVHRAHHLLERVWTGYCEHLRMGLLLDIALGAETAGDDDAPVLGQRLADGSERFLNRGLDEPAGVDDHQIGTVLAGRDLVTLRAQARQNAFRVDQRLGTAETHKANT